MKFRYSARTKTGELQVGYVEAIDKNSASGTLAGNDLYILSIERIEAPKWYQGLLFFFNRVKRKDMVVFTRQFATMLEAKIPIHDSLTALYYQTPNPKLREAIFEVSADIDAGLSLSQALEKHSDIFHEFFVNMVQSAEVTGRLEDAMRFLADFAEKDLLQVSKVKTALVYPVFVLAVALITGAILMGFVFPQLQPLFSESQVELPIITRIFLAVGNFINDWWLALVAFFLVLIFMVANYLRTEEGKAVFDQLILNAPFISDFPKKFYVARFAEITSVLIKGGIPIAQAIEIGGHTVGSALYREMLHEVAEGVRRGELLSQAFQGYDRYFPPIVTQMVTVGEQTGKLDEMFVRIGAFYSREVEAMIGNLIELIQPVLMVILGILVSLLFSAILLPIYSLIQTIG